MGPAFALVSRDDLTLWLSGPQSSAARPMPDGAVRARRLEPARPGGRGSQAAVERLKRGGTGLQERDRHRPRRQADPARGQRRQPDRALSARLARVVAVEEPELGGPAGAGPPRACAVRAALASVRRVGATAVTAAESGRRLRPKLVYGVAALLLLIAVDPRRAAASASRRAASPTGRRSPSARRRASASSCRSRRRAT